MSQSLKVTSLQTREIHVHNKVVFSNPYTVLSGSNTTLLFARVDDLEKDVADLSNGGGGFASDVLFPSVSNDSFVKLTQQLLGGLPLNPTTSYNAFGRFRYNNLTTESTNLIGTIYNLPNVNSQSHLRLLNETDLDIFPLTTSFVFQYTNSDATTGIYSMSSELISARNPAGFWSFYTGS
jgi:hypothetical protein